MTVGRAPLTITPADRSRVYGAGKPSYAAGFDGLVNGDTASDITGLQIDGPAKAAGVGSYDIVASAADNPNYAYTYQQRHRDDHTGSADHHRRPRDP